jgi:hypothetical protein
MPKPCPKYKRADDFFRAAKKTTIAADVKNETRQEQSRTILDKSLVRRQEDWSLLANKTVGAECA